MAATVELSIDQGADYSRIVQLFDATELIIDITGCTAKMQFRRTAQSAHVLLEASSENGKLAVGTTDGNVTLILTAADTMALKADCVYDCKLVFPTGVEVRAFEGVAHIDPAVTR